VTIELLRMAGLAKRSGVPAPTIKHYLREGLLTAAVSGRNSAHYDARLADRVKVIKELQTVRFLPLKLIGEVLEPAPSSRIRADLDELQRRQLGALAPAIEAGAQAGRQRRGDANRRRTRADVLASLQITEEDLALLASLGLAVPVDGSFAGSDLDLLEVIDETRARGFGDLFPMEILEPYAAALRTLVQFELDLFRRRVLAGARLPAMPLDELTRDVTALGERLVIAMRARLVLQELNHA